MCRYATRDNPYGKLRTAAIVGTVVRSSNSTIMKAGVDVDIGAGGGGMRCIAHA
jgi:hypothetical protein